MCFIVAFEGDHKAARAPQSDAACRRKSVESPYTYFSNALAVRYLQVAGSEC
jgi:hypothetical protein